MTNQALTIEKRSLSVGNLMSAAVIVFVILCLYLIFLPAKAHAIGVGDIAPDFKVTTLDGKEISYNRNVKIERPLYLVFWTTW